MADLFGPEGLYRGNIGSVSSSDTSVAAGESIVPTVTALRRRVLRTISQDGTEGATCDRVEAVLGLPHQTVSARIRELSLLGLIEDTGLRRPTRSGRNARVYLLTNKGQEAEQTV